MTRRILFAAALMAAGIVGAGTASADVGVDTNVSAETQAGPLSATASSDSSTTGGTGSVQTEQTVLVGVYGDPTQPGEGTKVVEALADYLVSVN
ncbi:profilin [Nocardia sp. IFM 10818]